jgi:hypothetical protein
MAGTLLAALALASLTVTAPSGADASALPRSYLVITAGLLLLGGGMVAGPGLWGAWRAPPPRFHRPFLTMLSLAAVAATGVATLPLLRAGGVVASVAAGIAIGAAGVALVALARGVRLADGVRWLDRVLLARPPRAAVARPWDSITRWALAIQAIGAAGALLVRQLDLLLAVVLVGVVAGTVLWYRRRAWPAWPVSGAGVVAALLPAWYLLNHVAGEMPHTLAALRDAPYSPAFEVLVALLLLGAGWALLSLWPFHGVDLGPLAPLLGAAVVARVAGGLTPDGVVHWQAAFAPLAAIAAWHAAASRRVESAAIALGALGLLASGEGPHAAGVMLVGAGVAVGLLRLVEEAGLRLNGRGRVLIGGGAVVVSVALLPAIVGGLRMQLAYTVATALGAAAAACFGRTPWQAE